MYMQTHTIIMDNNLYDNAYNICICSKKITKKNKNVCNYMMQFKENSRQMVILCESGRQHVALLCNVDMLV